MFILATEAAIKATKCTLDVKYSEGDAALDIYYPSSSEGTILQIHVTKESPQTMDACHQILDDPFLSLYKFASHAS